MIDPDWRGLKRGPDGKLYFDGWAVFGHLLPLAAVVRFPCYADGETVAQLGEGAPVGAFDRLGVVIEWLGRGFCFAFGPVRLIGA